MSISILVGIMIVVYFGITWLWMWWTLGHKNTINYYIFQHSLNKPKVDFMHYVERAIVILMLIGFVTTAISSVQIIYEKRKGKNIW